MKNSKYPDLATSNPELVKEWHPKEVIILNTEQIERALSNILQTVNAIFYAVYKRNVPILNYGLQSVKNYRE